MKYKFNIRREVKIVSVLLILSALIAFTERMKGEVTVTAIQISLENVHENHYLDEKDIMKLMRLDVDNLKGARLSKLNFSEIEHRIRQNPFVSDAELYSDLKEMKKLNLFPGKYNTHLDLGRSALLDRSLYDKPDSIVYLQRLPAEHKGKKGFIYFYKYKAKKDDLTWKLATVGLVPQDPALFEFDYSGEKAATMFTPVLAVRSGYSEYDFTGFSDTKLKDQPGLGLQLGRELKKMLYSRHNSAKEFYKDDDSDRTGVAED